MDPKLQRLLYPAVWFGMDKLVSMGLLVMFAGCGGGDGSDRECIPGDGSRVGYICSDAGNWEARQSSVTIARARDESICPSLPPGTYVIRHSLPSGAACPLVADDPLVVNNDGSFTVVDNPLVEKSTKPCTDHLTIDGCQNTLKRECQLEGCTMNVLFALDTRTNTGVESLIGACSDGSSIACSYDVWVEGR
jgi:hypothetical protein